MLFLSSGIQKRTVTFQKKAFGQYTQAFFFPFQLEFLLSSPLPIFLSLSFLLHAQYIYIYIYIHTYVCVCIYLSLSFSWSFMTVEA